MRRRDMLRACRAMKSFFCFDVESMMPPFILDVARDAAIRLRRLRCCLFAADYDAMPSLMRRCLLPSL